MVAPEEKSEVPQITAQCVEGLPKGLEVVSFDKEEEIKRRYLWCCSIGFNRPSWFQELYSSTPVETDLDSSERPL